MIQTIAIQSYFAQMRHFFTRQGFDTSMKVVYGADAQGNLDLLDKDLANKPMDRKQGSDRETVRKDPYTYLFWTKGPVENIIRRSARVRDGIDPETGAARFKKFVSVKFPLALAFISNKGNAVEDFEEAFAAEWQNIHNAPLSLKWAFPAESEQTQNDYWMNATVIQDLGTSELVSYRTGNLFAYTWSAMIHLNFVSEFAEQVVSRVKHVVVDLYNENGIPLASIGEKNKPTYEAGTVPDTGTGEPGEGYVPVPVNTPKEPPEMVIHTAADGTTVEVPEIPYFEKDVSP